MVDLVKRQSVKTWAIKVIMPIHLGVKVTELSCIYLSILRTCIQCSRDSCPLVFMKNWVIIDTKFCHVK